MSKDQASSAAPLNSGDAELRKALEIVARWELPETGEKWGDGTPMSYGAAFGSNGERDYMRKVARAALAVPAIPAPTEQSESIRDFADFREDLERLSEPGLAKAQAKVIRKAIYDTIDARVRNFASRAAPDQPAVVVPEGWQLVPIEPTEAMRQASYNVNVGSVYEQQRVWKVMLAASPAPPSSESTAGQEADPTPSKGEDAYEITKYSLCIPLSIEQFAALEEVDYLDAVLPALQKLGAEEIEYDGHFGSAVFLSVDSIGKADAVVAEVRRLALKSADGAGEGE